MTGNLEAAGWDARYKSGQYESEPPIAFVDTILEELGENGLSKFGLYIGVGNGRNYIPLLKNGLRLQGIDISAVGLEQLVARQPEAESLVRKASFDQLTASRIYDYLVAIQVFQHGNINDVNKNFRQAGNVLKPGGKLFLRVNSASTEIFLKHHLTENNKYGGFTVVYDEDPKSGAKRHFFTHQELEVIAANNGFEITRPMVEVSEARRSGATGTWSQWEAIWQKT